MYLPAAFGDTEALSEAIGLLGLVDRQLQQMCDFWINMAAAVTHLKNSGKITSVFLKSFENPRSVEKIRTHVDKWKMVIKKMTQFSSKIAYH